MVFEQLWGNLRDRMPEEKRLQWRKRMRRLRHPVWLGTLRRTSPLSAEWGYDRGTPIDRYYIEHFLEDRRESIHGRVLEIKDSTYTKRLGAGVTRMDVLDVDSSNPHATLIADLTDARTIPANSFDCFILTQTLQFIYDVRAAIAEAHRLLCPGGVLLATVPTISRLAPRYGLRTDCWRFTPASCTGLFGSIFGEDRVAVYSYGNVLAAVGFLSGLAQEELKPRELDVRDEYFPLILGIRAVKREGP